MPDDLVHVRYMVDDVERAAGLTFRNDIVTGPCGRRILVEDPAGNPIELFRPAGA